MNDQSKSGSSQPSRPEPETSDTPRLPYTAFYSLRLRASIRHMSEIELRIFMLLSTYVNDQGVCWPGLRELSDQSGYRQEDVLAALECLEAAGYMAFLRRGDRDPFTRQMTPNVYAVNPQLVKVANPNPEVQFSLIMELLQNPSAFWSRNHHQESRIRKPASANQHQQPPHRTVIRSHIKSAAIMCDARRCHG